MRHLPLIIVSTLLLLLVACGKIPGYVISPDKMAEIMADLHTGEAVVDANGAAYRNDSVKRALMQSICEIHGVTTADLDTSLYWYGNNLPEYVKVYDKTIEILNARIAEVEKSGAKTAGRIQRDTPDGDSVNIWRGPLMRRNTAGNPSDFISFTYNSERNWERGDRYTLYARPLNPHSPLFMTLAVTYNDGTAEYVTLNQGSEGRKQLTLVLDSAKTATNLYGTIHYSAGRGEISYIDSIALVRTRGRNDNVKARQAQHTVKIR